MAYRQFHPYKSAHGSLEWLDYKRFDGNFTKSAASSSWTTGDGYITMKNANDASIVFPAIYDTAPLTIPVLQPGQTVVHSDSLVSAQPGHLFLFRG